MEVLLILLVILIVLGGGGWGYRRNYYSGQVFGFGFLGLICLVILILYLLGGRV